MKFSLLQAASCVGIEHATERDRDFIILTNQISWLLGALPLIYITLNVYNQGWARITLPIITQPLLFLIPIGLNWLGYVTASRVVMCWSMPVLALIFSIYNKSHGMDIQTSHYLGIRFSILASSVLPFLVFPLKNRGLILVSLFPVFVALMAFDAIHKLFGVGYYDSGLNESGYGITDMRVMIALLLIFGASLFLKRLVEKNEALNQELIRELTEKNNEIQTQLEENTAQSEQIIEQRKLESQFDEITHQRDQLRQNEIRLSSALDTIKTQQEALLNENKSLEFEVLSKNKELMQNNQQLIRYNNELQQFSYTVSHNLRGPVATMLGLMNVIEQDNNQAHVSEYEHLRSRVQLLDEIIRDLNKILDIRNEVAQVRQSIDMHELVEKIKESFKRDIEQLQIHVMAAYHHYQNPFSIQSMVGSILYNLVSNAIKYHSPDRRPEIRITCSENSKDFMIKVWDNGIGLDIQTYREKLFQLYKRFNTHTEGKGIGLYLIKLQAEMLGGRVEVTSELDQYTEFTITLPLSKEA